MKFAYIEKPIPFFLGACAFAWAFGFIRYFDHWVFFSTFPNVLDSLGMSLVGVYLFFLALQKGHDQSGISSGGLAPILSVFDDIDSAEDAAD